VTSSLSVPVLAPAFATTCKGYVSSPREKEYISKMGRSGWWSDGAESRRLRQKCVGKHVQCVKMCIYIPSKRMGLTLFFLYLPWPIFVTTSYHQQVLPCHSARTVSKVERLEDTRKPPWQTKGGREMLVKQSPNNIQLILRTWLVMQSMNRIDNQFNT